ncbi:MAG: cytochrome C biogenesis protein ResC [Actinobacteria bacterium HGW-Actinobacteria-6]|nr:MAG: cytochrome C biogenesis protein ResC [Actinobacteria bacterium HGW-Actinobacteria-6]
MTQTLLALDPRLHLLAAAFYAVAFVTLVIGGTPGGRVGRLAIPAGACGMLLHAAGIVARWIAVGHGPVVTKYENLSAYAIVTAGIAVYLLWRRTSLRQLGLILFPVSFLMLGFGLFSGTEGQNLPPTFGGIWLVLHVCFYFLAFSTAVTAAAASVLLITGKQAPGRTDITAEELDVAAYRYAGLAFSFWGIGMLTGAIWAFNAWGRYWAWDPVETWSLVTWLVFGAYLHLRRFYRWDGRRAAWLLVICFGFALMSLFGTTLLNNSLHSVYFK